MLYTFHIFKLRKKKSRFVSNVMDGKTLLQKPIEIMSCFGFILIKQNDLDALAVQTSLKIYKILHVGSS